MTGSLLFAVLFFPACAWLAGQVKRFLAAHGVTAVNYRGDRIPVGSGFAIWLAVLAHEALLGLWRAAGWEAPAWARGTGAIDGTEFALLTAVVCFAGWLDDTVGDGTVKGFRGHVAAWRKEGTVTTGLLKAAAVSAAALRASVALGGGFSAVLARWLVITLLTNAFNLLDLRPGRALKAFLLLSGPLIVMAAASGGQASAALGLYVPALAGALVLLPGDLKARAMLGDTGANLLGFALGLTAAAALPPPALWGAAALLALLHWQAERRSLTRLIERNRLLAWLDRLGRPGP